VTSIEKGYSIEVLAGWKELLESFKEGAIEQEGKVDRDSEGVNIPIALLPSAVVHMAQVGVSTNKLVW
jgi:hypothetical protein